MNDTQIPKQAEGEKETQTAETKQTKSVLDEAREVRDQIKAENDRREMLMKREEEMYSINLLSGKTDAGDLKQTPEQMKKAEAQKIADEIAGAFR